MKTAPIALLVFLSLNLVCPQSYGPQTRQQVSSPSIETPADPEISSNEKIVDELWIQFRQIRDYIDTIKTQDRFTELIAALHEAAQIALQLNRQDIAAWQLNNIGYFSILEFKKRTDFDRRLKELDESRNKKNRQHLSREVKSIFFEHIELLEKASVYLEQAYDIDGELGKSDRTEKIYNNMKFIDWVINFTHN